MTFLIFLIILGVLVFVHELGHFLAAKKAGVRVDEFGFGYPPRALIIGKKWGTIFTLNWIPFGGFVKIAGENYEENDVPPEKTSLPKVLGSPVARPNQTFVENFSGRQDLHFTEVSKKSQATILASGVIFNILFAWLLFSFGFLIGLPTSAENDFGAEVKNPALTIIGLTVNSPAQKAGLKTGDKIKSLSLENGEIIQELNPENISGFINKSSGLIEIQIDRGGEILNFKIMPETSIAENSSNYSQPSQSYGGQAGQARKMIGVNMDMVGTLSLPLHKAFYEGGRTTLKLSYLTVSGITGLIKDTIKGEADISQVTGPVGIVGLVGDASRLGFAYLINFTALISINLAIINLVPFPALDGGRIVFVAIEGVSKRKINPKIASALNTVGFFLLIALMLVITYRDILKLF